MRTRYGVSPWIHQFPDSRRPDYPKLRGEHVTDVVILGGGLTGCATAQACAAAGLKTILLEADRIGQGSAGRSAGLLLPEPGPSFRDIVQAHGLRTARRVFESWRLASLDAAAIVRRLKIRCDLKPLTTLTLGDYQTEKLLHREFDARNEAGLAPAWLTAKQVRAATGIEAPAAIRQRDAFALDPYRACLGLAAAATARKAKLFERSHATKVKFHQTGVEVTLVGGVVRATTVVVTTGSATSEFAALRRHFKRSETYLVLTEPLPAAMRKKVGGGDVTFRDTKVPRRRLCWTADGRIVIAGGDQGQPADRLRDAVRVQRTGQLMYDLLTMYPVIEGLRPEYGWELAYGETADGLMYIGPHRNYPHHLFALGGPSDSVTGAFLAAGVVTRSLKRASEKEDQVFSFTR